MHKTSCATNTFQIKIKQSWWPNWSVSLCEPLVIHSPWCPGECHPYIFELNSNISSYPYSLLIVKRCTNKKLRLHPGNIYLVPGWSENAGPHYLTFLWMIMSSNNIGSSWPIVIKVGKKSCGVQYIRAKLCFWEEQQCSRSLHWVQSPFSAAGPLQQLWRHPLSLISDFTPH